MQQHKCFIFLSIFFLTRSVCSQCASAYFLDVLLCCAGQDVATALFKACAAVEQQAPGGGPLHSTGVGSDTSKLLSWDEWCLLLCRLSSTVFGSTVVDEGARVHAMMKVLLEAAATLPISSHFKSAVALSVQVDGQGVPHHSPRAVPGTQQRRSPSPTQPAVRSPVSGPGNANANTNANATSPPRGGSRRSPSPTQRLGSSISAWAFAQQRNKRDQLANLLSGAPSGTHYSPPPPQPKQASPPTSPVAQLHAAQSLTAGISTHSLQSAIKKKGKESRS